MKHATVHLEIVTPCFLGGADNRSAEWRAASMRGQLRWWFRAVAGGEYGGSLEKTKAAEAAVFGATSRRSAVAVRALGQPGHWPEDSDWPRVLSKRLKAADLARRWHADPADTATLNRLAISGGGGDDVGSVPLQYLAYGCVGHEKGRGLFLARSCFAPGEEGAVGLQWSDRGAGGLSAEAQKLLGRALWAWLHLGGLGSKSRNGYGSLQWKSSEGSLPGSGPPLRPAQSLADLETGARELLASGRERGVAPKDAAWAQFGKATSVHLGAGARGTWHEALTDVGAWLVAYRRRYGLPSETRSRDGRSIANRDYLWAPPGAAKPRGGIADRAGFGLPLPFGQHGETATWWFPGKGGSPSDHRRASPLQIHVARLAEGFVPVLTHLPAQFLPEGAELAYTGQRNPSSKPAAPQLGIIGDFLEDLTGRGLVREVTP